MATMTQKNLTVAYSYVISWIIERGELDRKRVRPAILNVWHFGNPLKYSGLRWLFVVPLLPHRDCSGAYLLYRRIGLQPVCAQSGQFCSES